MGSSGQLWVALGSSWYLWVFLGGSFGKLRVASVRISSGRVVLITDWMVQMVCFGIFLYQFVPKH